MRKSSAGRSAPAGGPRKPRARAAAGPASPPVEGDGDAQEHGIEGAVYVRTAIGLDALLYCLCGFVARGDTWAEAGQELDDHHAAAWSSG